MNADALAQTPPETALPPPPVARRIPCRKKGSLDAPEQVTLDLNALAQGHRFLSLGAYAVSDDGSLLAYSTDFTGFRDYTLQIFIRTNDRGRNFRQAPVADPRRENWQEVVPHRGDVMLEGQEVFRDHYVLREREQGLPRFRVTDLRHDLTHHIAFPEPAYFDYDMEARTSTLLKEQPVRGGYDRGRYQSERIFATPPDGVKVPVSIVYRRGRKRDGSQPMLLTGYGAYGFPFPVGFSSNRLSLLDRGFAFAIAHVRGGGELGKPWHDDGRMMRKRNTFTDFIALAEQLAGEGFTSPERLVVEGGSAGGLAHGRRRQHAGRPVQGGRIQGPVRGRGQHHARRVAAADGRGVGGVGRSAREEALRVSEDLLPLHEPGRPGHPAMLVRTAFNDSQVMYWEPAKYVAKLRALKTDDNVLLLKTNMEAGHGGASGRYDHLREVAFDYAFVLASVGIVS